MLVNLVASVVVFIVQLIISFWLSPYIVSKVGEEAYGFINLANSFVSYASLVAVAVNSMANRFISVEYNKGRTEEAKKYFVSVFIINCILSMIIIAVCIFFVFRLESFINISPDLVTQVKLTFLFSFLNMVVSFIGTAYTAAVFSTNKMHLNSFLQILSNVVRSALILGLFLCLPPKIYYLSITSLIAGVIVLVGNYYLTKRIFHDFDIKIEFFDIHKIITLVESGVWMLISNVSNLLLNGLDLLIANQMISGVLMGRLSIAKQLPNALGGMLNYFSSIFTASLTQTYATDTDKGMLQETRFQLRILTVTLTVPFAGVIIYGQDFLHLWLSKAKYTDGQIMQVYILMIITLIDIIVSTYMYSIHSVFLALNRVKVYAITLFISSIISAGVTILLVKYTGLGIYAIAGTSVVVLGITHGIIVPGYAAKFIKEKVNVFWISELKSWSFLGGECLVFLLLKQFMRTDSWFLFGVTVVINAIIGYILSFMIVLKKDEKELIINKVKSKCKRK